MVVKSKIKIRGPQKWNLYPGPVMSICGTGIDVFMEANVAHKSVPSPFFYIYSK